MFVFFKFLCFIDIRRTLPFAARGAQYSTLETLWSRMPAEWWRFRSLLLQALCRQSFVHWGSILVLVRGLAPYSIPLLLRALSQMTPEMWLELVPIPHRCHAHCCRSSPYSSGCMHGVAFFLHWLGSGFLVPLALLAVLRLGGLGNQIFFQISEGRCLSQPTTLKAPHWKLCGAACACRVVEISVSTASGLVSTVLRALGQHSGAG